MGLDNLDDNNGTAEQTIGRPYDFNFIYASCSCFHILINILPVPFSYKHLSDFVMISFISH